MRIVRPIVVLSAVMVATLSLGLNPAAAPPACTWTGTPGPDEKHGTPGDDVLCGMGRDDQLYGGGGNDRLRGGWGDDFLTGERGNDIILGQRGRDTIIGRGGNDRLRGGHGIPGRRGKRPRFEGRTPRRLHPQSCALVVTIAHDEIANPQKAPKNKPKKSAFRPDCCKSFCALVSTIAHDVRPNRRAP